MIPLSVLKQALRIDFTADDKELQRLLDAAVAYVENYLSYSLCSSSTTVYLTGWVNTRVKDTSGLSVFYKDADNNTVEMTDGTDYWIDRSDGYMVTFLEKPLFKVGTQPYITFDMGYTSLPKDIQQAIIGLVGHWYANVEATSQFDIRDVPHATKAILDLRRKDGGAR